MGIVDWISHNLPLEATIGFAVVITFGLTLVETRQKRRREELDAWVGAQGLTAERVGSKTETGRRLKEHLLVVLPKGDMRSGSVDALWTGLYGWRPTTVADYSYHVHTGLEYAGPLTYGFTIVVLHMSVHYPPVRIEPRRGWLWRDSERSPTGIAELDRRFRISVEDPAVIGRLLGSALYYLLADKAFYLLDLRTQDLLLIWRGGVKVTNLAARLDTANSTAGLVECAAVS